MISFEGQPLIPESTPYALDVRAQTAGLRPGQWERVSAIFGKIQDGFNRIEQRLRATSRNEFDEIIVTDKDGVLIGWIGSRAPYFGAWFKQLYVGADGPDTAPLFANVDGDVIVGKNGSISLQDLGGNEVGWLGVQSEATKTITGATNATPIVITANAHGYENGDTVLIASVGGNLAANGYRIVQNATTNTFSITDLDGVNVAGTGSYTSGGTSRRYFGGGRFQTLAVGSSFTNYKIRAYADGQVKINGATFTLDLNGVTTTIGNILDNSAYVGLRVQENGTDNRVLITPTDIWMLDDSGQISFYVSNNGTSGYGEVRHNTLTRIIQFDPENARLQAIGCDIITSLNVEAATYSVGGVAGVNSGPTNYVTNVTAGTGSAITSVDFGTSTTTSGTFLTSLTLTTVSRQFTKGILIS